MSSRLQNLRSSTTQYISDLTLCKSVRKSRFSVIAKKSKQKRLNIIQATKSLKSLQIKNYQHEVALSADERAVLVQEAFDIYNNIEGEKDHVLINTMLKLILYFQHPHKVLLLWEDIIQMVQAAHILPPGCGVSWTFIMCCCITTRDIDINKCMQIFKLLKAQNATVSLNSGYIGKLINKMNKSGELQNVQYIHSLLEDGNIECKDGKTHFVKTYLIAAYGKCSSIANALNVFHSLQKHEVDVVCIATMLKAYINAEEYEEALLLYDNVEAEDIVMDDVCHALAIKSCKNIPNYARGKAIAEKSELNERKIHESLKNSLIDFYGIISEIDKAEKMYSHFADDERDTITINVMMSAYVKSGFAHKALLLYDETERLAKIELNEISHTIALNAAGDTKDLCKGKEIHEKVRHISNKSMQMNAALIDMYGKSGDLTNAQVVFDSVDENKKNIIHMNSMLAAYCSNKADTKCIELFKHMVKNTKLKPTVTSYQIVFRACTNGTAFYFGRELHEKLQKNKYMDENRRILNDIIVRVNIINMYCKCGMIDIAEQMFYDMHKCSDSKIDLSIWNAMIHGFGKIGNIQKAKHFYHKMKTETDLMPDEKTFMGLFIACSYSGHEDEAQDIWQNDIDCDSFIKYSRYVIAALVDCLARSGNMDGAWMIIMQYESHTNNAYDDVMWGSLLNGCCKHKDEEMAEKVYQEMMFRFKKNAKYEARMAAASVMMRNIYASNNKRDKAQHIIDIMRMNEWVKEPGFSEIHIDEKVHKFFAGKKYAQQAEYKSIDEKLEALCKKLKATHGYTHDSALITRDLGADETEESVLSRHSEKIALCYGLLNTPNDFVIVINKNLSICTDCHNFMRLTSLTEKRKIIVTDANRVHVFQDGVCSCNEYY